ncbi:response regulator [Taibaiella lutea]|uniref:Response regulator n=1 Tax=Taibaiella lutea TaxID=2608001 RepID=A0A5M6CB30_9BACT|nr:response regulator [Taibaiella lutea]KAA5532211.1 response regulator [Taibaiella lutea]
MNTSERKIIIFDDDEDIVSVCQYILMEKGWQVYPFADCNDPIAKVESIMPDVILMDNWIPDEGGIITTQKIKSSEHLMHIPVIFFSASGNIKNLAEEAGADAYLSKPFDLDALEKVVRYRLES